MFMLHAARAKTQAVASDGCLGAQTRKTRGLSFWTLTRWESEVSLKKFMSQAPHRIAMQRLTHWCDESVVARWNDDRAESPTWPEAAIQLGQHGRLSRLTHPSPRHQRGEIDVT
jgi:hypothetical protein